MDPFFWSVILMAVSVAVIFSIFMTIILIRNKRE